VVVSGTPFHRPLGQLKPPNEELPHFAPCKLLDFELEVGTVVGKATRLGEWVTPDQAEEHIFGLVLLNDWSARDVQTWEYQPLGPFNAKSFCTTISPWIVTLDALEPFRVDGPTHNPPLLPYLAQSGRKSFDIALEAWLTPAEGGSQAELTRICATNFRAMYYSMHQQLAHMTSNGAPLDVGDLYGSGTVSGTTPDSFGSLLELTWRGANPLTLAGGVKRTFLADGDSLTLRGFGSRDGVRVGFGEARGTVLPARSR
jgi:fumarylacetoacetase